jgi:hypothetical protein
MKILEERNMRSRSQSLWLGKRGYTILIVVNLLVLLVVMALSGAYYFYRLSAGKAVEEYEAGHEFEKEGDLLSADEAYREAVRLDPLNAQYKRRLHQLEFRREQVWAGEGGEEAAASAEAPVGEESPKGEAIASSEVEAADKKPVGVGEAAGGPGAETLPLEPEKASAALLPEGLKPVVAAVESEEKGGVRGEMKEMGPANGDGEEAAAEAAEEATVRLSVVAPDSVEYRIESVEVEGMGAGDVVEDWGKFSGVVERAWAAGEYAILARTGSLTPWRQKFEVRAVEAGEAPQEIGLEFALLKIGGDPLKAEVRHGKTGERIGFTPYTLVRPPSKLKLVLRSTGFDDAELEIDLAAGEVTDLAPKLKKAEPTPEPVKVAVVVEEEAPRPEIPGRPVTGKAFMNGDGNVFEFRSKSSRGDPFWRSEKSEILGMSVDEARGYCRSLNLREEAAGRVPSGYAYFPSLARDGKIVLARDYSISSSEEVVSAIPVATAVVVRTAEPVMPTADLAVTGLRFGEGFTNGEGMTMEYRSADYRGNPYWQSSGAVLGGLPPEEVGRYLWELTKRERAAGRLPSGYTYAKEMGDTGRYVLVRSSTTSVKVLR